MPTEIERIATLEAGYDAQHADIIEIKADVKTMLEYQNKQKGQATVLGVVLTALIGIGGWFGGSHLGR